MNPYMLIGIASALTVAVALTLILTPTECSVMRYSAYLPVKLVDFPDPPPYYPQIARHAYDQDGKLLYLDKRVFSSLEESEIITVDDPPYNALGALMFWIVEGGITVSDSKGLPILYNVECTDIVSQTVKWMFPSMFPHSTYEERGLPRPASEK